MIKSDGDGKGGEEYSKLSSCPLLWDTSTSLSYQSTYPVSNQSIVSFLPLICTKLSLIFQLSFDS